MTDQADQADGELIVGNAPPVLPVEAARAIAAAAQEHGFEVPPSAQAAIDAADALLPTTRKAAKPASPPPASAGGEA